MNVSELLRSIKLGQDGFRRARYLYSDRLAPDFFVFDFIQPDEVRFSSILGWLLDPSGTHGQGGRFLQLFVRRLFEHQPELAWSAEVCTQARTQAEYTTSHGRVDIIVTTSSRTLVIENKVGAGDQREQVKRYLAYLDSLIQAATCLIYLSPDGSAPSEASITKLEQVERSKTGQLHCWSYQVHILDWLTECRSLCRADRVSMFIDEFARYIGKNFSGVIDMTERQHLIDDVTQEPTTVAAAMEVIMAADAIRAKLLSLLHNQVEVAVADREGWFVTRWNLSNLAWSGFSIGFSSKGQYEFCIEFGGSNCRSLTYGLATTMTGNIRLPYEAATPAVLSGLLGPGKRSEAWPWYRIVSGQDSILPVEADWRTSAEPWVAIADGKTMVERIIRAAETFRAVLAASDFL